MGNFKRTKLKHQTVGKILEVARQTKKKKLSKIARQLNIKLAYLEALEQGDFSSLPADVYTKGFLRKYAKWLGLDPDKMVALYTREKKIHNQLPGQQVAKIKKSKIFKTNPLLKFSPKTVRIIIIIILAVLLITYLSYQFLGFSGVPNLEVIIPSENEVVSEANLLVKGKTDPDAEVFINNQPVFLGDDGTWQELISLRAGVNTLNIVARNKLGKTTSVIKSVKLIQEIEPTVAGESDNIDEVVNNVNNRLVIDIINGETWLQLIVDDELVFEGVAQVGDNWTKEVKREARLTTGRAGNTYVVWQGEDLGALGELNQVIRDKIFKVEQKSLPETN